MGKYCLIPDDCNRFWSFIDELPLPNNKKHLLKASQILRVEISTQPATWSIIIKASEVIEQDVLKIIEQYLCQKCALDYVTISQSNYTSLEVMSQKWNDIINQLCPDNPSLRQVLHCSEWQIDGDMITLTVVGQLSTDLLVNYSFEQKFYNHLKLIYGLDIKMQYVVQTIDECDNSLQEIITQHYLEAQQLSEENKSGDNINQEKVLYGKKIKTKSVPMSSIQDEAKNVVCEGVLLNIETRKLNSGRFLLSFDIADSTDGLSSKIFFDSQEQFDVLCRRLKKDITIKVKGTVKTDKFANELMMFADSICLVPVTEKVDSSKQKRIELHAHTRMSSLDSVASTKKLIQTAAKWGHPAIAITDHGVVQAFPEAHEIARKENIKIIYGMEGYLIDNDINSSYHIIILAQNAIGLHNLYKIVSISHLQYMHRKPRIPRSVLNQHREGLILGSACEAGELYQAILGENSNDKIIDIASYYDFLEIQPLDNNQFLLREGQVTSRENLAQINKRICELGTQIHKPVVATCDVHFVNPEDEIYRRILMCGQGYKDAECQPPLYLRTTEEMLAEFSYLGQEKAWEVVVANTHVINDMIDIIQPIPDELYSPQIPGAEEQIQSMSYQRAKEIYGDNLPEIVQKRLDYELNAIINNGFAVLYLIAHKLVKKSLDDGYLVGSRGSVGSSFVATMTSITEVNPLPPHWVCPKCQHSEFVIDGTFGCGFDLPAKLCLECGTDMLKNGHNIPFAVFMGFHGEKVPDIDLNFSGEYQPVAHKYTEELFGRDNVFRAGTISTIADKTAYGFVKNYFNDKELCPRKAHIDSLVQGCTGVKRTTGQHPGGIMVVPRDMDVHYFTPIQYPADDKTSSTITTHFDYHSISSRLVKLDILGHDDPTVIKMLEDLTQSNAKQIPMDDPATLSLFFSTEALKISPEQIGSTVGTFGVPEFGTKFVRQMLEDTKPKNFSELVRISGFSHGTDVWLNNAQDLIKKGTAQLSEAISARDDIMTYLIQKGLEPSKAFTIMESVRKGKGVNSDDINVMKKNNVPDWYVESCQKIKYMFPKAHAVAYVMMAFRIAYYKIHYPLAFYAAYFSVRATDFDADLIVQGKQAIKQKMSEIEQKGNTLTQKEKGLYTALEMSLEMNQRGISFKRVDLYDSDATHFIMGEGCLLPPLAALQGLGENAAKNIVVARSSRQFISIDDLKNQAKISKSVIDILKKHGCISDLPETDQMQLFA